MEATAAPLWSLPGLAADSGAAPSRHRICRRRTTSDQGSSQSQVCREKVGAHGGQGHARARKGRHGTDRGGVASLHLYRQPWPFSGSLLDLALSPGLSVFDCALRQAPASLRFASLVAAFSKFVPAIESSSQLQHKGSLSMPLAFLRILGRNHHGSQERNHRNQLLLLHLGNGISPSSLNSRTFLHLAPRFTLL
ncbi:hypothetical protein VTI74DRAFT_9996 [Chaetomium olivicolor]